MNDHGVGDDAIRWVAVAPGNAPEGDADVEPQELAPQMNAWLEVAR